MVNSCVAINCTNRHVKGNAVKFHKFPLENKELTIVFKMDCCDKTRDFSQLITSMCRSFYCC